MNNNFASTWIGMLFISGVIAIIIFLVFREVFCWYWKINQNIALLTEIRDLLAAKGNLQGGGAVAPQITSVDAGAVASPAEKVPNGSPVNADSTCPNCSAPLRHDDQTCWKCGVDFSHPQGWKPVRS